MIDELRLLIVEVFTSKIIIQQSSIVNRHSNDDTDSDPDCGFVLFLSGDS